jgi:hypothetical protein
MAIRTYDPKSIAIIVGGVPITGLADGTFLTAMRANDAFTKSVGADGDTTRVKSNDKSGEVTITLDKTSLSNDYLSSVYLRDELANAGVVTIRIKDLLGASTYVSATGWIRKLPEVEYSKETSTNEWVFDIADFGMFVGGNFDAVPLG